MAPTSDDTAAAVEKAKADLAAAEAAHTKALEDAPPREPTAIIADFMSKVAQRFGNHHELAALCAEFGKANAPKEETNHHELAALCAEFGKANAPKEETPAT